jgi:solute:Na+ symporter, SSS family
MVMGLTTLLWVTVALLTKPDPDKLLTEFYQRVQPLGWWGKYASNRQHGNSRRVTDVKPIFRGLLVAVIGFSATCLLIQALTEMWFGRYAAGVAELSASVILFFIFRRTSTAYLNFLEQRVNRKIK